MITRHRRLLEQRCEERGYTLKEVMPCVVSQEGDQWTIDTEHPAYPVKPKPGRSLPTPTGPGTELKQLLAKIGIVATPGCDCNKRAAYMDANPLWCEDNIDQIVGWLREEAAKRGLPFLDVAGRVLVRRAIANARRKDATGARRSSHHD